MVPCLAPGREPRMVVAFGDVTWSKIAGAWDVYRRAAQLKLRANKGSVPGAKLRVNDMPWFGSSIACAQA